MSKGRILHEGPLTISHSDGAYVRKMHSLTEPLPVTFKWIAQLPPHVRPFNLLRHFPHVANALATNWPEHEAFQTLLHDLLDDKSFPDYAVREFLALRSYFATKNDGSDATRR
jgi:hypothetical protein